MIDLLSERGLRFWRISWAIALAVLVAMSVWGLIWGATLNKILSLVLFLPVAIASTVTFTICERRLRTLRWKPPELGKGDVLIETYVEHADGTREPIVVILKKGPNGIWDFEGYSRPLILPSGAKVVIPAPPFE